MNKITLTLILIFIFTFSLASISSIDQSKGKAEFVVQKTEEVKINGEKHTRVTGYIDVPENRSMVGSRVLKLPVIVFKSTSASPLYPVFRLAGGPGESNITKKITNGELLKNHDFVFVGYRGVDGSMVLNSKKLAKALKGVNSNLLSDESLDNINNVAGQYLQELEKQGVDINMYTILEMVEDFEYARKALGYEKINLLSTSYGTRVALLYSYRYPEVINRTVMNGANPPGHFLWYPSKTEEILNRWDQIYASKNLGSVKEAMVLALERMPQKWSFFKLDKDKIKTSTFVFLYSTEMAEMAFDSYFRAAHNKDYSGLFLLQVVYDLLVSMNIWGDMFQKGFSTDFDPNINYREFLRAFNDSTILGPNFALLLWGGSSSWESCQLPEQYRRLRPSSTETLILSGELDVSTPVDYTIENLLPTLSNAHHIVLKNMSHLDVAKAQPENYRRVINEFFKSGEVNLEVFNPHEINFEPRYKLYNVAKWGFSIVGIILIAVFYFLAKFVIMIVNKFFL